MKVRCIKFLNKNCSCTLKQRIICTGYIPTTFDVEFLVYYGFSKFKNIKKDLIIKKN